MTVGVFGGSFNPVQMGHIDVVRKAHLYVDHVLVVPCQFHPFAKDMATYHHRLAMLELAFQDVPYATVSRIEEGGGINYSADTIRKLRKERPDERFSYIIGSDIITDLPSWHDFNYLKKVPFIVVEREGYPLKNIAHWNPGINLDQIIIHNPSVLSSTEVRSRVQRGQSLDGIVPAAVETYIREHGLYLSEKQERETSCFTYINPASTVDLLVEMNGGLLLVKRKNEPFKGQYALPGGFIDMGKETLEQAAVRELMEETGLEADPESIHLVGVYSSPTRDPRGHVIDHAYAVRNVRGRLKAGDDAAEAAIFTTLPERLAFDHAKIIADYFVWKSNNGEVQR